LTQATPDGPPPVIAGDHSPGRTPVAGESGAATKDRSSEEATRKPDDKSIAILPFTNRSSGRENTRFLSDGIHDDLLTRLSKIQELKVISRTSVMTYRDSDKNLREIGEELGVSTLLEGGVQQSGERVRVNVQLIDAKTDQQLWAESYDREVSAENIFEIQGEIAHSIAHALQATISPREDEGVSSMPTRDFEAYQAVLISRQLTERGGFGSLPGAAEYARKAIELDPGYADAHLALAHALTQSISTGTATTEQIGNEATAALNAALQISPEYDLAWSVLGHYQAISGQPAATESFERAMKLNPGNAHTLSGYGDMLQRRGHPHLALPLLLRASELDPISLRLQFILARTYEGLEEYEKATSIFARIREVDPASPLGYAPASGPLFTQGQLDLALYWLDQGQNNDPKDFEIAGWLVFINDSLENYEAAGDWSGWLESWVTNEPQPMAMQALHHYLMGDFDTALQYSNIALRLGLPDRWGSDAIFMRIKRDEALANGDPDSGIEVFRSQHPELFREPPNMTADNLLQAVDLSLLLKLSGKQAESGKLLRAAIDFYDQPWAVSGSLRAHLVPAKAEALVILGKEASALSELRRIIDKGWRVNWRFETELNFNFNGVRENPEFKVMLEELQADMANQRANAQSMTVRGDIKPPPIPE
jgi:TolB-like protein/Tfp pilus assembly protein PilF